MIFLKVGLDVFLDLDPRSWRTINWIAIKHDAHHLDNHKGSYATIILLCDWLFGTPETNSLELKDREAQSTT